MSVAADFVGMEPAPYDVTFNQGATFKRTFTWKDSSSSPIDLTNCTGRSKVRDHITDAILVSPTVTLGGSAGTITIQVPDTSTSTFAVGDKRYLYDVEIVTAASDVIRVLQGRVSVTLEQTR